MPAAERRRHLRAEQARQLHAAEHDVTRKTTALEESTSKRDELRARYRHLIPASADTDEAAKGICEVEAGGVSVRVAPTSSGERFSLGKYRELGGRITASMRRAMSPGKPYDRWTVKLVDAGDGQPSRPPASGTRA